MEEHLRPLVPSGGGPFLQAYRRLSQKSWAPFPSQWPRLKDVTRIIRELGDDMFGLESMRLMSPSSSPHAQHSAPACMKCHPAADLPAVQPSPTNSTCTGTLPGQRYSLPKPPSVDVSNSAPTCTDIIGKFFFPFLMTVASGE